MPIPDLQIQPAAFTLLRFPTIFFTPTRPSLIETTILGRRVTIIPRASTFVWHFGDGTQLTTDEPGRAYPDETITHKYEWRTPKVPFQTRLDIIYTARFRIEDSEITDVPGTITQTSPTRPLLVKTARTVLIDPNAPYLPGEAE
jgi:hypothetical protein